MRARAGRMADDLEELEHERQLVAERAQEWLPARVASWWLSELDNRIEVHETALFRKLEQGFLVARVQGFISEVWRDFKKTRSCELQTTNFPTGDDELDADWKWLWHQFSEPFCKENRRTKDWLGGDFVAHDSDVVLDDSMMKTVSVAGLRIHRNSFIEAFGISVPKSRADTSFSQPGPHKGGRPASNHGAAIAATTLRLSALPKHEFNRYTVASLSAELAIEYEKLGEAAPAQRNLDTYASGILRVLRAHET
jgi:hypothetical protein